MVGQLASSGLFWEWVDGVDARAMGEALFGPGYVSAEFRSSTGGPPTPQRGALRPGAVACALAHRMAWERLGASDEPWALVLEDDVDLPQDIAALAGEVGATMSRDCSEVALLNFHRPGGLEVLSAGAVPLGPGRWLAIPAHLQDLSSGAAYLLTREAARRLAAGAFPMRAFSDEWGEFARSGLLEQVRVVAPMPVRQSPAFPTAIDYYQRGSLLWWLHEAMHRTRLERLPGLRAAVRRRRLRSLEAWGGVGQVAFIDPGASGAGGPGRGFGAPRHPERAGLPA